MIITAEGGPPQSEPTIMRAVVVDHTRISISWEQGRLKNGPILFYVLRVKESNQDGFETVKVHILFHKFSCTWFSSLIHVLFPAKVKHFEFFLCIFNQQFDDFALPY